jgi:hypothetical protein
MVKPGNSPYLVPHVTPKLNVGPKVEIPKCPHVDLELQDFRIFRSEPVPGGFLVIFSWRVGNMGNQTAHRGAWKLEVLNGGHIAKVYQEEYPNPQYLKEVPPGFHQRGANRLVVYAGEFTADITARLVLSPVATPLDGDCNMGNNSIRISKEELQRQLMGR